MSRWYTVRDVSAGFPEDDVMANNAAQAASEAVATWLNECGPGEATTDPIEVEILPHGGTGSPIRARVQPKYIGWRAEVV